MSLHYIMPAFNISFVMYFNGNAHEKSKQFVRINPNV